MANETTDLLTLKPGSFGYDMAFLKKYDDVIVLKNRDGKSLVAVSPKYQAKVFTSSANGNDGYSFGWINYKIFDEKPDPHMNGYGGENRFWLGPEGGVYSLFFEKGKEMIFDHWHTPAAIDTDSWTTVSRSDSSVQLQKKMQVKNYTGTLLSILVDRFVTILNNDAVEEKTGVGLRDSINAVGYVTQNSIKNTGSFQWDEKTGMPCIWMLDMFRPSPSTTIIIPYKEGPGSVATTSYFGEIPDDRIKYEDDVLYFKADGKSRGKLGLTKERTKSIAGSWDAKNNVLTIIQFDVDATGKYLNQEWNTTKPPFSGDAVNAYNDGPLEDGSQMGPFYELESVSPAAFLKPGETLNHDHYVFHFTGSKNQLIWLAQKTLGVSLQEIESIFK